MTFVSCVFAQEQRFESDTTKYPTELMLNNQLWRLDFTGKNKTMLIAEYVKKSENVHNWTELFTYQKITQALPKTVTAKVFAENIEKQLSEMKITFIFNTIKSTDDEAIIEFRISKPKNMAQDEIQRIVRKNGTLYIVHYVTKQSDMGDQARNEWLEVVREFKVPLSK